MGPQRQISNASADEVSCEFGSSKYYALCGLGGVLSCGITHTAIVPLDLVKCRIQVDPAKYKGILNGFKVTVAEGGMAALTLGWAPTAMGYSVQGLGKFGFYELFKIVYGGMIGEENAYLYRTSLYLVSSASAEFFADIGLAPFEAIKVGIQTKTGFPQTFRAAVPVVSKLNAMPGGSAVSAAKELGMKGLWAGLTP